MTYKTSNAYLAGVKAGKDWPVKWDHLPGGPYYCDDLDRENNVRWKEGFKQGLTKNKNASTAVIQGLILKTEVWNL